MTGKRKDANQPEIEQALQRVGALWIDCTGDPRIGFDGLIAYRGQLHICEIKNGALQPSAQRLTDGEQKRKSEVEYKGVRYNVLTSVDDALRLIGAIR